MSNSAQQQKQRLGKYILIRSKLKDRLVLGIQDGVDRPGAPVVLVEWCDGSEGYAEADHQMWFVDASTGTIRNKLNSFCLDVKDDALMVQPYLRGAASQRWMLDDPHIQTSYDPQLVVAVRDGVLRVHAPCCLESANSSATGQHWTIEHCPAQYFYIRSLQDPKKVIDIRGDSAKPGAQVIVYPDKGDLADNQLWYEDEKGIIRSKLSGFALDASDPSHPQKWVIRGSTLTNIADHGGVVLEMKPGGLLSSFDTLVAASPAPENPHQNWSFDYVAHNSAALNHLGKGKQFIVRSRASGLVLQVEGKCVAPGTPLVTAYRGGADQAGAAHQRFYADDSTGTIRSELNGFCIDIDDGDLKMAAFDPYSQTQRWRIAGQRVQSRAQLTHVWTLASPGPDPGVRVRVNEVTEGNELQDWDIIHLPARCFHIVSQLSNKVLDIRGNSTAAGASVIMYDRKTPPTPNQLWYEDESGVIRSKLNGFVLDASSDTVKMRAFDPSNTRQYWQIVGDRVQNKYDNRLVLDIVKENKSSGAQLCAYRFMGGDNQRWKFEFV